MAEMLRDADSTAKHLSTVRRHIRLCNSVKGAAFLVPQIDPAYKALIAARDASVEAIEAEEDAKDLMLLKGLEGADLMRTTSERTQQYDREGHGAPLFGLLFPEGGFGEYLNSNGTVSVLTLREMALKIKSLGASHPLSALAVEHENAAVALETAEQGVKEAVVLRHQREAAEELAQAALRKAYEGNYFDARKKLGKTVAERVFPKVRKRSQDEGEKDEGKGEK